MKVSLIVFLVLAAGFLGAQSFSPWVQQASGTQEDLLGLHFTSPQTGYVVGENGTALRTTNGGDTWASMSGLPNMDLVSVAFSGLDTGYVLPFFGDIQVTHDAGNTWVPDSTFFLGSCYWKRVRVDPAGLVYLLYEGCFGNHEIYTWNPVTGDTTFYPIYLNFDYDEYFRDVDFPEAGTAVVVGDSGMILRTTDSGDNWTIIPAPDTNANFRAVDFVDADTGYAITTDLYWPLWKTVDGGINWGIDSSWVATFFYPDFHDIEYRPGKNAYLVGAFQGGGVSFKYDYWGGSWIFPDTLTAVDMEGDSLAWTVGDGGFIAKIGGTALSTAEPYRQERKLTVYPNPVAEALAWRWPEAAGLQGTLVVSDLQGRQLLEQQVTRSDVRLDLRDWAPGVYFLQLKSEGASWRSKFLKQ